jgi:hypothetical protein
VFLRRDASRYAAVEVELRGIDQHTEYEMSASVTFEQQPFCVISAQELRQLTVTIDDAPGSLLNEYRLR